MEPLYKPEDKVKEISAFDFGENNLKLYPKGRGIIIFYAPWCGACKRIRDTMVELAEQFEGKFHFLAVNCENPFNYNLRWRIGFDYFPTIKYFYPPGGNLEDYTGELDKDSLILFLTSKLKGKSRARSKTQE